MIVVTTYTPGSKYEDYAKKLEASCDRFGIQFRGIEIESRETWHDTDLIKIEIVRELLLEYRRPICWMDSDCEIVQFPTLLIDPPCDFAAYNWHADPDNTGGLYYDNTRLQVSGGVLYFRYSAPALELVVRWEQMSLLAQSGGTDPPLDAAFNQYKPPVNPIWLPKSYNRMDSMWPDVKPVINHEYCNRGHRDE
jgi:hypothetical protein